MMKILLVCLSVVLVGGCASVANLTRDPEGRITKIDVKGQMKGSVEKGDEKISWDSKTEPLIKDVISMNLVKDN